jgi:hypothetical protein
MKGLKWRGGKKEKAKRKFLTLNDVATNNIEFIESRRYWFIKWPDFNFGMELEAEKSQEFYG